MLVARADRRIGLGVCIHVHLVIAPLDLHVLVVSDVEPGDAYGLCGAEMNHSHVLFHLFFNHIPRRRQQVLLRQTERQV